MGAIGFLVLLIAASPWRRFSGGGSGGAGGIGAG
jgi:hypothetical protein